MRFTNISVSVRWLLVLPASLGSFLICQIPILMLSEALDYTPIVGPLVKPYAVWFMHCALPPFCFVVVGTTVSPASRPGVVALALSLTYSLFFLGAIVYLGQWELQRIFALAIASVSSLSGFYEIVKSVDEHNREMERESR